MDNTIKENLKNEIPERPNIIGFYDEMEERWTKGIENFKLEELKEMSKFVRATIVEVLRISPVMKVKEVEFGFIIDGKKVGFSINIEGIKQENKIQTS